MEIIENKALKLLLRNPSRVTEVIPKSKVVGTKGDVSEVLVHWGFDECIVLKNLGIKNVPSPINKDYAWHGLYKPFNHQKETAAFLTLHKRAYCLNEMGTGKTVSVLWAADYLLTKGYIRRVLIVCPLSIMHSAWKADAFKSVMHRTVDVAHGSREKRTEIIKGSADIVVINYDGIEIVADAIAKSKFDLIVIDECFPKGTKVFTPSGDKNIEDIREGDIVESSWGPRPVTKVFKKQTELLVEVSFDDGKKIKCTPEHPFATTEGWIAAKDLQGKWCINSEELPALRKTRFCGSYPNDLYRSGWSEPFAFSKTGARQEKRTVFNGVRVDSVAYIEQNGICDVWNLEVDGPNDYIVNGVLVHNCNHYKNSNSKRWKVMNSLVKPNTWLWGLTGSPASQSPTDAYGLAKLMNPSSVPPFFGGFRDDVMYKVTQYKYIPRPNAMEFVYKVLQPAVRFTKAECLDLPERTYTTREVPLSAQQKKYYKQLKEQMLIEAAGEEISTANAAINLNKLMQIASGAVYSDNKEVIEFDCNNRLTALEEIVEEASKKVIVFATFKHSIAVLQDYLSKKGYSTDVIHGGVPLNRRSEIFSNFQTKPDPHILIIQPRSASHGVTLTAANVVVWWSPTPSVETYIQANDRVHRAGQDTPCTVVHLCGSPVEERFYKALEQKGNLLDGLLGLYKDVLQA